jgi:hypothetical protein
MVTTLTVQKSNFLTFLDITWKRFLRSISNVTQTYLGVIRSAKWYMTSDDLDFVKWTWKQFIIMGQFTSNLTQTYLEVVRSAERYMTSNDLDLAKRWPFWMSKNHIFTLHTGVYPPRCRWLEWNSCKCAYRSCYFTEWCCFMFTSSVFFRRRSLEKNFEHLLK